ncbi:MAG: FtsX-like permease family protein, partial [Vicinamibacterales bacterium]
WIMARGVTCFEFGAPLRASLAGRIAGIEGVRSVDPVVVGFSVLTREDQQRRAVLVLGVDHPTAWTPLRSSHPQSATIDHSAKSLLGMNDTITTGEVNGQRVRIDRSLDAGGSFMGTPLLAGRLDTARDWLGLDHRLATFLTVSLHSSQNAAAVAAAIRREHPEIDAQEREVFAEAASRFWLTQTGAGGGILLAGVLGFAIGLAVVSQTLFAHTVDHLDDYATFLAIGGTHRQTTAIVMGQGLVVGAIGSVAGVSLLWPAVTAARASLVSWIAVAWWMPVLSVALGLGMAMLAAAASVRKLRLVDPAQVFRS